MTLNDYQKAAERTSGNLTSWDKVRNYPNVLWTHQADMLASHVAGI